MVEESYNEADVVEPGIRKSKKKNVSGMKEIEWNT